MGKPGRKKRGRNRGYFYRNGRGWYANDGKSMFPFLFGDGSRIKDKDTWPKQAKMEPVRPSSAGPTPSSTCAMGCRVMGNSVQVGRDHYMKWTESMNDALWAMAWMSYNWESNPKSGSTSSR
jgi:hypothetical protein